ncbi:hypothetical protein [Crenobacter cavernae]|uniref:Lipoprotein n=1 Tax=Crenobacter cavernae TaxID=2290923 RepID=A0ABY0FEL4_9NEIS|nr:hypothetical protein [Crenobacter cavernae]RXZ42675.1 hypothetical protein EBB06_12325 [Crenobacter cavernae]
MKKLLIAALAGALLSGCGPASETTPAVPAASPAPAGSAVQYGGDSNGEQAARLAETRKQIEAARSSPSSTAPSQPAAPPSKWSYDSKEDKMRGQSRYFASLTSSDMIQLAFPYNGGTDLELVLRDDPEHGKDIMLWMSKGQLPCYSYDGCSFSVKFDDGPIQRFSAAGPASSGSDTLFISGPAGRKKFMAGLRKAKRMIVEVNVYDAGRQQFTFEPVGLQWERF